MASGEEPLRPSEVNQLAALAKNGSPQEREDAWRKLEPVITECTFRVAWNLGLDEQEAEEYAEEGPTIVSERFWHYQVGRNFIPWLKEVLKNWIIDDLRKKSRRREVLLPSYRDDDDEYDQQNPRAVLAELAIDPAPEVVDQVSWRVDLYRPFSEADLRTLEKELRPKPRILSLVIAGLWDRVPEERWKAWCAHASCLCDQIPFDQLKDMDDPETRLEFLCDVLNRTKSSMYMMWYRACQVLGKLEWWRPLQSDID